MKKLTQYLIIIIILSLIFSLIGSIRVQNKEKKAIIILPGFMGSMLVDEENIYWMTYALDNEYISPRPSRKALITRLFDTLIMDEEGNRRVEIYPPNTDDTTLKGGTYNEYLDIYLELQKRFGTAYDIINFQYDWMKSDIYNAQKLDEFIKQKGYDKIVLLAHSMGGLVADNYLALGSEQRDKVSLFATFGSPHGGVVETLVVLESKEYGGLPAVFSTILGDIVFDITRNMPAFLQMLPNEVLLSSPYYKNAEAGHSSFIRIEVENGIYEYLTNWGDITNFYATREWSKYITDTERAGETKNSFIETLDMFSKVYYKNNDGVYEHISQKVNSYYFVGKRPKTSTYACVQYNLDGSVTWINERNYTDGTVSAPSAAAGFPLTYERVIYKEGYSHGQIFNEIDENKETPMDIIEQKLHALK